MRRIPGLAGTFLAFAMMFAAATACMGGTAQIKARMKARLPKIEQFKNSGVLGENNQGFLAVLIDNTAAKKLAAAENRDRKAVYKAIAKAQGTTAELVGRRRALQLVNLASKGQLLQDKDGKWYKKK